MPNNDGAAARPSSPLALLKHAFSGWSEDKAMKLSAALALYTILSLAPLLVITIKVLSLIVGEKGASGQVQAQMQGLIGPAGAQAVHDMISNASKPGSGILATVISFVILVSSASGVFGELQDSLNTIWKVKPRPNLGWWVTIRKRLFSMAMVFVIAFLLMVSLLVSTVLTTLTGALFGQGAVVGIVVDIVASILVMTALFAAIFKFLPDAKVGWRDVIVGAVLTAVLFKGGQYLLGLYFKYGSSTSAYGAAGSFVAVLLWVYYSAWILFFGAEFTKAWVKASGRRIEPDEDAVKVTDEERARRSGMLPKGPPDQKGRQAAGPVRSPDRSRADWEVREREWD